MHILKGKHNQALIMVDWLDSETTGQIIEFLNHPALAHSHIAIMADAHKGAGSCIGFTMTMNQHVVPNMVGVDIGCGVLAINLGYPLIDYAALDDFIKERIPSGFSLRNQRTENVRGLMKGDYDELGQEIYRVATDTEQDVGKVERSLGTLGGGNHFIEIGAIEQPDALDVMLEQMGAPQKPHLDTEWLLIHTGSRNFGLRVAQWHQAKAKKLIKAMFAGADAYKDAEYLPMEMGGEEYIRDMQIAQRYASFNRAEIAGIILREFFGMEAGLERIETVHNYINLEDRIVRKGAVSAHDGERLVIPFNMRDGTMIGVGKGSKKWNYSAPHGAGRILSRSQAKKTLDLAEYQAAMEGIYTTTATQGTIDEAPMAYKDKDLILEAIGETVEPVAFMRPVYNFKSSGD